MSELHTTASAASRVSLPHGPILFRIGLILAVFFSLTFAAPVSTASAQNAPAGPAPQKEKAEEKPKAKRGRKKAEPKTEPKAE